VTGTGSKGENGEGGGTAARPSATKTSQQSALRRGCLCHSEGNTI